MDPTLSMDSKVKDKLLPPAYASGPTIVELSQGQTRGVYHPTTATRVLNPAEKHHTHHHASEGEAPGKFGGACRTVLLILLTAAVCAGFGMLYTRMRELERQVDVLVELTGAVEAGQWGYEGPLDWQEQPGNGMQDDVNEDRMMGGEEDAHGDDTASKRERRSAVDGAAHHLSRRTVGRPRTNNQAFVSGSGHGNHYFAHLRPLLRSSEIEEFRNFEASEFLEWTDDGQFAFTQFQLEQNKYLVAPFTGYYYIYSQVTINDTPDGRAKGHGLWVRSRCGQANAPWQELTYTLTTQSNGTAQSLPRDSSYLGGVFLLRQHDHVGVKPRPFMGGSQRVRLMRTGPTDYFGAMMLSRVPASAATVACGHNHSK